MACQRCRDIIQHGKDLLTTEDLVGQMSFVLSKDPPASSQKNLETYLHHTSARDLKAAMENGCYLCSALWETIGENDRHRLMETDPPPAQEKETGQVVTTASVVEAGLLGNMFGSEGLGEFTKGDFGRLIWMLRVIRPGFSPSPPNQLMAMLLALPVHGKALRSFSFGSGYYHITHPTAA